MTAFLDLVIGILRPAAFFGALSAAVFCLIDWLVRTRRVAPFSPLARFARNTIDPLIRPVERSVVRAGGQPSAAPLWALVFVVLGGIVLITLLQFARDQLLLMGAMSARGPGGVAAVLISWTFSVLKIALIVRVLCAWIRVSPYSRWVRWAFVLTNPILDPLGRIVPPIGMIDVTPIVAYLALSLLESGLLAVL
jgi:YggT family protein